MIPHIIHLCWFGRGDYPELAKMCIDSWKRYLPDYEIKLWNEDTFDVNSTSYTKEAYRLQKWAFVSDYVRLVALEKFGGIYMDTDVEVIKDFSGLLENKEYVSSTLEGGLLTGGFIACTSEHQFIKTLKDEYDCGKFQRADGTFSFLMNPILFTQIAIKQYQYTIGSAPFKNNTFYIFSLDYFMPYRKTLLSKEPYSHKNYVMTENTYAIHHDMGSWGNESKINWLKRSVAREIIPMKSYLRIKENRYRRIVEEKNESAYI